MNTKLELTFGGTLACREYEDGHFVAIGGTIPMLLSGYGDPLAEMTAAAEALVTHIAESEGVDAVLAFLRSRNAETSVNLKPGAAGMRMVETTQMVEIPA